MSGRKCSFCRAEEERVKVLVGDSEKGTYICDNCWRKIGMLLGEVTAEPKFGNGRESAPKTDRLELNPERIKAYLDRHIIGQDYAKKVLSVAVYNHYKMMDYAGKHKDAKEKITIEKSNILMLGPTGVGKTAIIKTLAHVLQVPFAVSDATTMTENGYVGADPESCIQRLLRAADGNVERAQTGIVYIDEIDKLACKGENMSITRDVSGEGVQQALLKIIEGTRVDLVPEGMRRHPAAETVEIDTSNILFIVGGAFVGLDQVIRDRLGDGKTDVRPMGFCVDRQIDRPVSEKERDLSYNAVIDHVSQEDIRKFGIIPELLGRLPVLAPLHELQEEDLCRILTEPRNSLVKQYQEIFRCDNIDLQFTEGALRAVADKAIRNGIGARGLRSILETVLLDKMFTAKKCKEVKKLQITKREVEKAFSVTELQKQMAG